MLVCLPERIVFEIPGDGLPPSRHKRCPDGWREVTRPANRALVCLPDVLVQLPADASLPPGGCPDGWRQVTPPLNPVLGCLPDRIVFGP